MPRTRVNSTRIYVMVDDPAKGRMLAEVLGTVTTTQEWDIITGLPTERSIRVAGDIIRQTMWDGRSPMPEEQRELPRPQRELE